MEYNDYLTIILLKGYFVTHKPFSMRAMTAIKLRDPRLTADLAKREMQPASHFPYSSPYRENAVLHCSQSNDWLSM